MDLIKIAEQAFSQGDRKYPDFKAGDTVTVTYKIKEENKERLQKFRGVVIQRKGQGTTQTFTVRKISNGIGVERIFPLNSPFISEIDLNKSGKVRRAKIFYLRNLTGKKARIKEKRFIGLAPGAEAVRASDYGSEGCGFESRRGHSHKGSKGRQQCTSLYYAAEAARSERQRTSVLLLLHNKVMWRSHIAGTEFLRTPS